MKYVQENSDRKVTIIIFGDGPERRRLEKQCFDKGINNVVFKGSVNKKYIPSIVCRADINLLHYMNSSIWKYGGSQNKLFEYLASGKPVLSTITMGYDVIRKYGAGISLDNQSAESIGKAIIRMAEMENEEYMTMGENARNLAKQYDFDKLTDKLIKVIQA
jgi:glycosyltransferase involved in cell wall biosynthesis